MRTTLVLAVLAASGCDSSQTIRQSGLVPRPRPEAYDGQPMAHNFQIDGHADTAAVAPKTGTEAGNGATVARTEVGGEVRFARGPDSDVGLMVDVALSNEATPTGPNEVAPTDDASYGFGFSIHHSVALGQPEDPEGWRLGLGGSMMAWDISRREETGKHGGDGAPVFAISLVPSKRFGSVVAFGSLTLTNQVSVPASFVEATGNDHGTEAASAGGGVVVFGLGARVDISDGFAVLLQASQTAGNQGQDVPMIGASIVLGAGPRFGTPQAAPPPPPMYAPPPYAAPPGAPPPAPPAPPPPPT